jgi:hypothetical protein
MKFDLIDFGKYNKPPFYPQYLSRGETKKLVSFDDEQFGELDRLIDKTSDQYDLDKAKGILLDRLGKLKDVPRDGNEDELYRLLIRLQIMLDTTDCSVPDIIKIIKVIYSSEEIRLQPKYPAGIIILHDGENDSIDFNKYLSQIIAAGVGYETMELFKFTDDLLLQDFEPSSYILHNRLMDDFDDCFTYGIDCYDGSKSYGPRFFDELRIEITLHCFTYGLDCYDGSKSYGRVL